MTCDYRTQSRMEWGKPAGDMNLDGLKLGAILRIADSLEKIERMMYEATPAGAKEAKENAEAASRRLVNAEAWDRIRDKIIACDHTLPNGLGLFSVVKAFLGVIGNDANPDLYKHAAMVAEKAPHNVYWWGPKKSRLFKQWIDERWPEQAEAKQ